MAKFARPNSYNGKQSNQSWTGQTRAATAAEAAAGDAEQLYISPATLASAVGDLVPSASSTVEGVVYLTEGTSSIAYPVATKFYADNLAIAGAPAWSETVSGIGQLATTAEAVAGTNDNVAITPLKLAQVIAAGGSASFTNVLISGTLGVTGLTSLNGSAIILSAGTAINIGSDASADAINLGTGAAARTITIGNVTGATAVAVNTGTGHFTVTTTGTGDIILNSDDTMLLDADGVLELNSSAGVISIGNDADAQNINIGTGAAQRVITIGNSTSATQVVINGGTAGINVGANAIAQTVTIGNQTGASAVVIDAGTGPITIGTTIAKVITIGNTTGVSGTIIHVGTGNFVLDGVTNSTYGVGASTTTGTITIGGTAQTGDLVLGSSSGTNAVKIMNGAGAGTLSLGVVQVAGAINMGTAMTTGTITIGGTGLQTGTISIAPGTGAQTVNIATGGTGIKTVNIATGAIGNIVTIGTVTAAASLSLLVGTGNFSLDGAATSTYTVGASTTSGTITIGGTAQTGTMTLGSSSGTNIVAIGAGTGATTVNIAGGAGSAKAVNIATGAVANVVTIGTVSGAASMSLLVGTGNFALNGNAASTYTIGAATTTGTITIGGTSQTGTATLFGGDGAQTISIANNTGIKTINIAGDSATSANIIKIGTGAGAQTLTLGSTNTTSATTINAGSGNVNVTGANLKIATTGKGLQVKGGVVTDMVGTGVLTAGTQTIANTNIATGDLIFIQRIGAAASVTLGELSYTISNGASFTVTSLILGTPGSTQTADVSTYAYFIVRPV